MTNLIKTDLKRIFKDKLFTVICIIGLAFGVITPLLYKGFADLAGLDALSAFMAFDGKSIFISAFNPAGDFGMILPVLVSIIIFKDFSQGTVRNKLICGKTRAQVFLSTFATSAIALCTLILTYAVFSLSFSLLFFNFQATPFTISDLGYMLLTTLFEILVYILISALVSFMCVFMKNVGVTIVVYVAITFFFSFIDGLLIIGAGALSISGLDPAIIKLLTLASKINVFGTSFPAGKVAVYSLEDVLCIVLPTVLGSILFVVLGILTFRKKDLK